MKTLLISLAILLSAALPALAQTTDNVPAESAYANVDVDQMPEFPGGEKAMMQWVAQNITYPAQAVEEGATGVVAVQMVIDENGNVTNVSVKKGVHPALDREAVRVIKKMPRWKPGLKDGTPVKVQYIVPVTFRLR